MSMFVKKIILKRAIDKEYALQKRGNSASNCISYSASQLQCRQMTGKITDPCFPMKCASGLKYVS